MKNFIYGINSQQKEFGCQESQQFRSNAGETTGMFWKNSLILNMHFIICPHTVYNINGCKGNNRNFLVQSKYNND